LLSDAVLMPTAYCLASRDVKSWLIAAPMLVLNLPALPLAILLSVLGDDSAPVSGPKAVFADVALNVCLALVSSWVWAFVVRSWQKKRGSVPS